jgi:midasin (ATPase involved in ribosome maturation)
VWRVFSGRFSEFYVDEIEDREDLSIIVNAYLSGCASTLPVDSVVSLYLETRALSSSVLLDGSGQHPHYSVRSLVRALSYCRVNVGMFGFQRALYEGFCMSFGTPLEKESRDKLVCTLLLTLLVCGCMQWSDVHLLCVVLFVGGFTAQISVAQSERAGGSYPAQTAWR